MAKISNKLSDAFCKSGRLKPGSYSDGQNLYLRAGQNGSKSWVFRWLDRHSGKVRELGLGAFHERPLGKARDLAKAMNEAVADNATRDELAEIVRPSVKTDAATFRDYADELVAIKIASPKYKSKKHLGQWAATLKTYAYPHIGDKAVGDITVGDVHAILKPLWHTKSETATRLRQRIEAVIDYAFAVEDDDDSNNPARWAGRLKKLLDGAPSRAVAHHRAVPWADMPALMAKLRQRDITSALVLRLSILCALRSAEARGLRWSEVNLEDKMVSISGDRMKEGKAHRVPLNKEAVEILSVMAGRRAEGQELVFPGTTGKALCDVGVAKTLRQAYPAPEGERHYTPHGTARSSFRDYVAEKLNFPAYIAEMALAHAVTGVEGAYRRGDLWEKRREMMEAWGNYLAEDNAGSNVVPIMSNKSA